MEIEELRKEINQLLDNVVEHSDYYSDNVPIPSLEISYILTKVNKLQESMAVLKHLLEKQEQKALNISTSEKEIISSEKEQLVQAEKLEEVEEVDEKVETKKTSSLMNESAKTVEVNLKLKPIKNLVDAFSLNDRYLYSNELFQKDMNAFNTLIKSIDSCTSLEEAKEIITKENWDFENEQVLSFIELVERRFSTP